MKLYIKSESRDVKELKILSGTNTYTYQVGKDLINELPAFLESRGLSLKDISEAIPVITDSFTGTRQAFTVANTINYYCGERDLKKIRKAKYHKSPNINIT